MLLTAAESGDPALVRLLLDAGLTYPTIESGNWDPLRAVEGAAARGGREPTPAEREIIDLLKAAPRAAPEPPPTPADAAPAGGGP